MISFVSVSNFKCFSRLRLTLAPLTLMTGINGGGKSTSVQPLLLLTQALRTGIGEKAVALNGPLVKLGTASDVVPAQFPTENISVRVGQGDRFIEWKLRAIAGERELDVISGLAASEKRPTRWKGTPWPNLQADPDKNSIVRALRQLVFLGAVRQGPRDSFPVPEASLTIGDVGAEGEYAPFWHNRLVDGEVPANMRHPSEPATSFRKQFDAYLGSLFPAAQANAVSVAQASRMILQLKLSDTSDWQRPINTGYGLTYVFPILVALLAAPRDRVIIVDSPEAHLHPRAQSEMGKILARFAAAGRQIVVETHSDHVLNGVRLATKNGILNHQKISVHFFSRTDKGAPEVTTLRLDPAGRVSNWPRGFFDQTDEDLSRLADWT